MPIPFLAIAAGLGAVADVLQIAGEVNSLVTKGTLTFLDDSELQRDRAYQREIRQRFNELEEALENGFDNISDQLRGDVENEVMARIKTALDNLGDPGQDDLVINNAQLGLNRAVFHAEDNFDPEGDTLVNLEMISLVNYALAARAQVIEETGDGAYIRDEGDLLDAIEFLTKAKDYVAEKVDFSVAKASISYGSNAYRIASNDIEFNQDVRDIIEQEFGEFYIYQYITNGNILGFKSNPGKTSAEIEEIIEKAVREHLELDELDKELGESLEGLAEQLDGEWITGSNRPNDLEGTNGNDLIEGKGGNDTIDGREDDDVAYGGSGDDKMKGGEGDDRLDGGDNNDRVVGGAGDDDLFGGKGSDTILGGSGFNEMFGGAGKDVLRGGKDVDDIIGGGGGDTAVGRGGNDLLQGLGGNDKLNGGGGNDIIEGGGGKDVIKAGAGRDNLSGGGGVDTFVFNKASGSNTIQDWDKDELIRITNGANKMSDLKFKEINSGLKVEFGKTDIVIKGQDRNDVDSSNFDFG